MSKALLFFPVVIGFFLGLTGCTDGGDVFIGTWNRVETSFTNREDIIEISHEDGEFYISRTHWEPFMGEQGDYVVDRAQARLRAENTMTVVGGESASLDGVYVVVDGVLSTTQGGSYQKIAD